MHIESSLNRNSWRRNVRHQILDNRASSPSAELGAVWRAVWGIGLRCPAYNGLRKPVAPVQKILPEGDLKIKDMQWRT
ncbi:hypothetical protein V8G57_21180 [Collimonas sp. H4R21]|jgi:hypothetical protein|uniref:Uncharacterized protein n=1 Tax=Collimonas rhizosphaerae TaxID=3126357 RepID=A0ABU9Q0Z3_9BURK|nr:hypothetical protein [Collimonas sp. OK412]